MSYPVPCPNIMPIFCQFFYKLVLVWCQFHMVEVKGGRLVSIGHHIARGQTMSDSDIQKLYIKRYCTKEISLLSYVLGSLIFLRFSSAFSSPIPTWQPSARRVLWDKKDTGINNRVQGHRIQILDKTSATNSLESLARHLQVVVPLRFRETLEIYQTRMEFLVVIPELWRKMMARYQLIKKNLRR